MGSHNNDNGQGANGQGKSFSAPRSHRNKRPYKGTTRYFPADPDLTFNPEYLWWKNNQKTQCQFTVEEDRKSNILAIYDEEQPPTESVFTTFMNTAKTISSTRKKSGVVRFTRKQKGKKNVNIIIAKYISGTLVEYSRPTWREGLQTPTTAIFARQKGTITPLLTTAAIVAIILISQSNCIKKNNA